MKLTYLLSVTALAAPALSFPIVPRASWNWYSVWSEKRAAAPAPDAATITALAPQIGFQSGLNPDGTGNCDGVVNGANGKPILIPCSCPPSQDDFVQQLIANVQAGHAVHNPSVQLSFPTDNSTASQSARLNAASVTIQNLQGPGVGCPIVSTTFQAQQKAIDAEGKSNAAAPPAAPPASSPAPASPAPASPAPAAAGNNNNAAGAPDANTITSLAPDLGAQSGKNPDGTGNCDGAVTGANGKPVLVPCSCPPAQDEYISQLVANVQAGHALKNPSVQISYPTDDSAQSQSARITAALITLQNLQGPGVGCPAAATTLLAQQKALGV